MSNSQERLNTSDQKHTAETRQSDAEQLEKLDNGPDNTVELSPRDIETRAEKARTEAIRTAISVETKSKDSEKLKSHPSLPHHGSISNKQRDESYARTLKQVQSELPTGGRMFSKITHSKLIEKTSDIVGNTIARPDAMLSGAIFAFVLTLLAYTVAKTIGYTLSGFETIAAFIIGWIIGIMYDYLRVLITGKKS